MLPLWFLKGWVSQDVTTNRSITWATQLDTNYSYTHSGRSHAHSKDQLGSLFTLMVLGCGRKTCQNQNITLIPPKCLLSGYRDEKKKKGWLQFLRVPFLDETCPPEWDGLICWPRGSPGLLTKVPCPSYIYDFNHKGQQKTTCEESEIRRERQVI